MRTTRLLLVRHGETVWNADAVYRGRSEVPLSEMGRRQALLLGRRLAEEGVTALCTSPLTRARETAKAISHATRLTARVEQDLTDLDCGEWEGLSDRDVKERYPDIRRTWLATPHQVRVPGGESLDEVSVRVGRVLERVLAGPGVVVLVSHRVVHKVAICALLGLDNSHFWDVRLDVAGVTEFECSPSRRVLVGHNDTCHLRDGHAPPPGDF
jgi:broad specificity phosphatase PhoE